MWIVLLMDTFDNILFSVHSFVSVHISSDMKSFHSAKHTWALRYIRDYMDYNFSAFG